MIISASYRTDIPTFYGEWFINRLRAGYCKVVNPYNRRVGRVDLSPGAVDGFVFWTKNVGPFRGQLREVRDRGYPFLVHHTINGYPRALEHRVVNADNSVEYVREVAQEFGPRVCIWRYDTIIDSAITPRDFHLKTFSGLAQRLEGATDEVVISFAQPYAKTRRNMERAAQEHSFTWRDPSDAWKQSLALELQEIARSRGMQLTICSQPHLAGTEVAESRCVDAKRLADVSGKPICARQRGNRKECGCFESRDIGDYDTCPHGCVYCYAVRNHERARTRFKQHDPESETLFPVSNVEKEDTLDSQQQELF